MVADNFFTGILLVNRLLEHDTYLIGTLRSNRAGSGSEVAKKTLDTVKFMDYRTRTA